jgi:putative peptide zinc metalloprotease protein
MSEALFSQSWYRVAPLKPRLRSHVQIHRHSYRGKDWYVIQDHFTGRFHRFSPEAYQMIGLMDGHRTLGQIWTAACASLGDHLPTQDEVIKLVSTMFRLDMLHTTSLTDASDMAQRQKQGRSNLFLKNLKSPLAVRFPLVDPDRFLTATLPWVRPLLGPVALLAWLLVVGTALFMMVIHWADLSDNLTDQLFGLENLFLLSLIYPVLKVFHEFGHAYMIKKWGGEVHEMGVMLLVLMPIPYVEASSSLSFRDKYSRMLVGAAGIMIEVFIAALCLLIWLNIEPGAVRAALFNVMLIAGVSTVLFNGNPLLRFDAYYVLADYLEIPNLGTRSTRYLGYLCRRYLIGIGDAESPAETRGEARWLAGYGVASFIYRIFITFRILMFIAAKSLALGLVLGCWMVFGMVVKPVVRLVRQLLADVRMQRKRRRIFLVFVLPGVLLMAGVCFVPFPSYTICEGITWAPEESRVHARTDGFIAEIYVPSGRRVEPGTPLFRLENPQLGMLVRLLEGRLREFEIRYSMSLQTGRNEMQLYQEELGRIEAELALARERRQDLQLDSPVDGVFLVPRIEDLPGVYVRRGTPLGYVLDQEKMSIRVLVPQAEVERVRSATRRVEVRLAEHLDQVVPAVVVREVPAASRELPSLAFSLEGGGRFALDPRAKERPQVIEQLFQFDVKTDAPLTDRIEERVYVRFEHDPEPLSWRWYRALRQLLLRRFAI